MEVEIDDLYLTINYLFFSDFRYNKIAMRLEHFQIILEHKLKKQFKNKSKVFFSVKLNKKELQMLEIYASYINEFISNYIQISDIEKEYIILRILFNFQKYEIYDCYLFFDNQIKSINYDFVDRNNINRFLRDIKFSHKDISINLN